MARKRSWSRPDMRTELREKWDKSLHDHFIDGKPLVYPTSIKNYRPFRWNEKQRKEQAAIIKYMLENPFASYREVAEKFHRTKRSVAQLLHRYPKIAMAMTEKREKEILDMYEDVLYDIAEITHKNIGKYKESDEKLRTTELKDLSTIAKETQERKNLIEGKPTENQNINITFS